MTKPLNKILATYPNAKRRAHSLGAAWPECLPCPRPKRPAKTDKNARLTFVLEFLAQLSKAWRKILQARLTVHQYFQKSKQTLLKTLTVQIVLFALIQPVFSDEIQSPPKKPLPPEAMAFAKASMYSFRLLESIQIMTTSGLAVGQKFKESQDLDAFLKASANDFAVAAEALLRAKATVSEMEIPKQKENCTLVVQNYENWLVAIGRLFDAIKEHDEPAQLAAAKDARTAYDMAYSSLDLVGTVPSQ
jgi:hypothetical protein